VIISVLVPLPDVLEKNNVVVVYICVDIRREKNWEAPATTPLINGCTDLHMVSISRKDATGCIPLWQQVQ
jgi:hypothetical protein